MMIRLRRVRDMPALVRLAHTFSPSQPEPDTPVRSTWVLLVQNRIIGYAGFAPVPGLPGIADLSGFIAPGWQRQGAGSKLLRFVLRQAGNAGMTQLSHAVPALNTPAARFLARHHFHPEHSESRLTLPDLSSLPQPTLPQGWTATALPEAAAVTRFRALYEAIFATHPWYQPYAKDEDVAAEMTHTGTHAADLLFLLHNEEPVGVAWLRQQSPDVGEIEPIGVLPAYQGRGLGRCLLLLALTRLRAQGVRKVQIAAWDVNETAIHLYHAVGFRKTASLIYLARAINPRDPSPV